MASAALYGAAALLVVATLAPLLAGIISASAGRGIGWAALFAAGAIVAAVVAVGIVLPARRLRNDETVARLVGLRHPAVASDLLSSVQLATGRPARISRGSTTLIDALLEHTAGRLTSLDPDSLTPRTALKRPAAILAAATLAFAVSLVADVVIAGWIAILDAPPRTSEGGAEVADQPLVGDIDITLDFPAYTGRPSLTLPSSSGDFRAMPGTKVTMSTRPLTPTTAATIELASAGAAEAGDAKPSDAKPVLSSLPMTVADDRLHVELVVDHAATYRFTVQAPDGSRRIEARPREIELEPDQTPRIELYAPADELDVTSLKRIELAYIAEDDYGLEQIELVWELGGQEQRRPLEAPERARRSAQGKTLWDLADVELEPGVRVAYHLEATDNDSITGPNVGHSKTFYLRVFSPRERHEQILERQRQLFENLVAALGARLVVAPEDVLAHQPLQRQTSALVVELGTLLTALEDDALAAADLSAALSRMRDGLDKLVRAEAALLDKLTARQRGGSTAKASLARIAASDRALVAELEQATLTLADWIDRQQMENLLAINDEVRAHQERITALIEEFARTGSPEIRAELEREMRALEQRLAELAQQRQGMAEDVLDRFVNAEAMQGQQTVDCMAEVRALLDAGDAEGAKRKMAECSQALDEASAAMEDSLKALRGEKFSDEERKLNGLMDELADVAQDQRDIAEEADRLWENYAERADEMMREEAKETRKKLSATLEALRRRLASIPDTGLTPFSREELSIVERRLEDIEAMLADGDLAEALSMAKQARAGLETIEEELQAALEDEQNAPWSKRTRESLREIRRARPLAEQLVKELEGRAPAPEQIMEAEDKRQMERLRRRQQAARERAQRLGERAEQMAGELPGRAAEEMSRGLRRAGEQMGRAEQRMGARDPSAARQEARGAAETLEQTQKDSRGAARNQQQRSGSGLRDEPIRIPGAEEYEPSERFREDILEAMKKEQAPEGFGDLVERYYEELIR